MKTQNDTWVVPRAHKDTESITYDWQFANERLIDGVRIKEIKPVPTGYGYLTEILRTEWLPDNPGVDQIFQSLLMPGAVSAWHAHEYTTDRLFASLGTLRVVLYDNRPDSPTRGLLSQFRFGDMRPALVVVPPKVWHGVQNVGAAPAMLINAVDRAYKYKDPDHWRVPADTADIPFSFDGKP